MNQIPNIEEVGAFPNDPTGLRREFAIMFHRGDFIKDGKDNSELISDWFHQQLQKARQDWLREEIVKLEGMKTADYPSSLVDPVGFVKCLSKNNTLQTIIDRYLLELESIA